MRWDTTICILRKLPNGFWYASCLTITVKRLSALFYSVLCYLEVINGIALNLSINFGSNSIFTVFNFLILGDNMCFHCWINALLAVSKILLFFFVCIPHISYEGYYYIFCGVCFWHFFFFLALFTLNFILVEMICFSNHHAAIEVVTWKWKKWSNI